jgi:hypothetical protein
MIAAVRRVLAWFARKPRVLPAALSIAFVVVTLSPLKRDPIRDDFPLSTFPMFAFERPTLLSMSYALGVTRSGERRYLSPGVVGTAEVLQARATIETAVNGGKKPLAALCAKIAQRVSTFSAFDDVVTIRIVTGTHESVEFLVRDTMGKEVERTHCAVPRAR